MALFSSGRHGSRKEVTDASNPAPEEAASQF
jgi:hypothetical protein